MKISELRNILDNIQTIFGDIDLKLHLDPDQPGSNISEIDSSHYSNLELIKMSKDNRSVILSNTFLKNINYKNIPVSIYYDKENKLYRGKIDENNLPEGVKVDFSCSNEYEIGYKMTQTVDEYLDFMNNSKIIRSIEIANQINKSKFEDDNDEDIEESDDEDLDYGEI